MGIFRKARKHQITTQARDCEHTRSTLRKGGVEAFAPEVGGDEAPQPRQPVLLGHHVSRVMEPGQATPGVPSPGTAMLWLIP